MHKTIIRARLVNSNDLAETHLSRDVHPLGERTEIFILPFVHSNIRVPQDERIEPGRRFQDSDRAIIFGRRTGHVIQVSVVLYYHRIRLSAKLSRSIGYPTLGVATTRRCHRRRVGLAVGIPAQDDARVAVRQRYFHSVDGAAAERGDESLCRICETRDGPGSQHTRCGRFGECFRFRCGRRRRNYYV
jgi:hypothetical protein